MISVHAVLGADKQARVVVAQPSDFPLRNDLIWSKITKLHLFYFYIWSYFITESINKEL